MPETTTDQVVDIVLDQDELAILNDIFDNADTNVANIATVFTRIQESKTTIDDYKYKVDSYKIYEDLVGARLEQLDDFCSDQTHINNSKQTMTELEADLDKTTEDYAEIVGQNNQLATDVKTKYDGVKLRLKGLAERSAKLGQNVNQFTALVANKRAPGYAAMLYLKIVPKSYAAGECIEFDTFAATSLVTNTWKLNKDFVLSKEGEFDYVYNGKTPETSVPGQAQTVKIKIESLASRGKLIDTTTVFVLHHDTRAEGSTPTVTNLTAASGQFASLSLQKNHRIFIKTPQAVTITSGVVKLYDFNVN